jgi:hypothetical protein
MLMSTCGTALRAEVGRARRRGLGAARPDTFRNARSVAHPLADDLHRHQLHRLLCARTVTIGLFMLAAENFFESVEIDRTVGQGHGELVSLSVVMQRG